MNLKKKKTIQNSGSNTRKARSKTTFFKSGIFFPSKSEKGKCHLCLLPHFVVIVAKLSQLYCINANKKTLLFLQRTEQNLRGEPTLIPLKTPLAMSLLKNILFIVFSFVFSTFENYKNYCNGGVWWWAKSLILVMQNLTVQLKVGVEVEDKQTH